MRDKVNVFTKTAILLVRKSMYITSKLLLLLPLWRNSHKYSQILLAKAHCFLQSDQNLLRSNSIEQLKKISQSKDKNNIVANPSL